MIQSNPLDAPEPEPVKTERRITAHGIARFAHGEWPDEKSFIDVPVPAAAHVTRAERLQEIDAELAKIEECGRPNSPSGDVNVIFWDNQWAQITSLTSCVRRLLREVGT